jgi:hypothetical protein
MPLTPEAQENASEFKALKKAQWNKFSTKIKGLQLIRTHADTSWMLVCSRDAFYEGVLIGQLERQLGEMKGPARARVRKEVPNAKKPVNLRGVDLTDAQISKIIKKWKAGESAASLKFVSCVWGRDGEPVLS